MSSRFSGRSQFLIETCLVDPKQHQQARHQRGKPEKADLPVSELRDAAERLAPQFRKEKRQETLDDQHEGEGHEERGAHSLAALPRVLEVLEEIRVRVEDQDVALVLERGAVGFEAAIE